MGKQLTCLLSGIIVPCAAAGYAADALPAPDSAFKAQIPILLDDVGFSTPALDVRANGGLRYNRLEIGFDTVIEGARDYPGYNSIWPRSAAFIADVLNPNSATTAGFV